MFVGGSSTLCCKLKHGHFRQASPAACPPWSCKCDPMWEKGPVCGVQSDVKMRDGSGLSGEPSLPLCPGREQSREL